MARILQSSLLGRETWPFKTHALILNLLYSVTERQGHLLADDARQLIDSIRQAAGKILTKVFKCLCLEQDT